MAKVCLVIVNVSVPSPAAQPFSSREQLLRTICFRRALLGSPLYSHTLAPRPFRVRNITNCFGCLLSKVRPRTLGTIVKASLAPHQSGLESAPDPFRCGLDGATAGTTVADRASLNSTSFSAVSPPPSCVLSAPRGSSSKSSSRVPRNACAAPRRYMRGSTTSRAYIG